MEVTKSLAAENCILDMHMQPPGLLAHHFQLPRKHSSEKLKKDVHANTV